MASLSLLALFINRSQTKIILGLHRVRNISVHKYRRISAIHHSLDEQTETHCPRL